jgi:hypothetical protein
MPENRLQRCRESYPELHCKHVFIFKAQSNIAPFINADGSGTTIKFCIDCGLVESYTRSQVEFEEELKCT